MNSPVAKSLVALAKWTLVRANSSSWENANIALGDLDVGKHRIIPKPESRWSLASGTLVTDFHGLDAQMDGAEIGVPMNPIRIGSLLALLHWMNGFGVHTWKVISFPPGTNWYEFEVPNSFDGPRPTHVQFAIADRAGAYRDNDGACRVDVVRA